MKYLKNFTEMITESTMYGKKEITDLILIEMDVKCTVKKNFVKI